MRILKDKRLIASENRETTAGKDYMQPCHCSQIRYISQGGAKICCPGELACHGGEAYPYQMWPQPPRNPRRQ